MLSENIRLFLEDFAQEYGGIDYNDISKFAKCWDDIGPSTQSHIRRIIRAIKKACRETGYDAGELAQEYPEDGETCEQLVKMIKQEIRGMKNESLRRRGRRRIREGFGLEDAPGLYRRIYKIIRDNHINAEVLDTDDNDDYGFVTISIDGDWKHDHLRLEYLLNQAFDTVIWRETKNYPSDDDCYEAEYQVYVADPKDTDFVEESYSINEELSLDDKKFREAVRFCDNTVEDLADELWRRYIELDDAIDCIRRFCERGKGRRSLLANIQSHIDAGDLEAVIEDVYFTKDDEMNSMKRYFGRV